jgi:hypothetical protein
VAVREEARKHRSRAAKKGWKRRKAFPDRDKVRWPRLS